MNKYTNNMLNKDIEKINYKISSTGYYLFSKLINGLTSIDEYKGQQDEECSGIFVRNIDVGTPKECLEAAIIYSLPIL